MRTDCLQSAAGPPGQARGDQNDHGSQEQPGQGHEQHPAEERQRRGEGASRSDSETGADGGEQDPRQWRRREEPGTMR